MSLRRLTTLIVFLVCGAGVALWSAQNFVNIWEPEIRSTIEQSLSQKLHERVSIGTLSLSFFNRLNVHNVQVWSAGPHSRLLFRADKVSLTLSLIDLPGAISRRKPVESIGLISIHSPYLELSPELVSRLQNRSQESISLPVLFTLAWDEGTVHWNGLRPGESLTFHETRGAFRIRGPKMDFALRTKLDQIPLIRLEFSRFGRRWNARALFSDANISESVALAETMMHRVLVPPTWKTQGRFTLELLAGGKHLPTFDRKPWSYLEKSRLQFTKASVALGPGFTPIFLNGGLEGRETRWWADGLQIRTGHSQLKVTGSLWPFPPNAQMNAQLTSRSIEVADVAAAFGHPDFAAGKAEATVTARGALLDPILDIHLQLPEGRVATYPFQGMDFLAHYEKHLWTLTNGSIHLWGGTLLGKGRLAAEHSDLKLSGENLSLAQAWSRPEVMSVDGLLNFSGHLVGAWNQPQITGSVWATHVSLGGSPPVNARGNLDLRADHLEAELNSDDRHFQFSIGGNPDAEQTALDHLHVVLPDGSSFDGRGSRTDAGLISGQFMGKSIPLPGLFIPLKHWTPGLKGTVDARLEVGGSMEHPTVQGTLESKDLSAGNEPLGASQVELNWSAGGLQLPAFHIGSTVHGSLDTSAGSQPWRVHMTVNHSPAEPLLRLVAPKAALPGLVSGTAEIDRRGLDIKNAHFENTSLLADASGRARWSHAAGSEPMDHLQFNVDGHTASTQAGPLWQCPFQIDGHWTPKDKNAGEARIHVPTFQLRQKLTEPFEAKLVWDHSHVEWSSAHWGNHWRSNGFVRFPVDPAKIESPAIAADMAITDAPVGLLMTWLGASPSQEVAGVLRGSGQLSGTLADPVFQWTGHLDNGHWRSFNFRSGIVAQWKRSGYSTLAFTGAFDDGGPFTFRGQIRPDSTVDGHLQLDGLNLDAIGKSLVFSQPLVGKVKGLLEVKGPLNGLQLSGHVEGGPTTYGALDHHPFRLESYFLDLALAPSPDLSGFTRITISKGVAKTAEEEIRLHAGSFAEISSGKESRLKLGTDLRNLHLGVFTLFGGLDIDGLWQIKPAGFEVKGDVSTRSLFINDYELRQGHVNADYYDGILRFSPPHGTKLITGTLDFRNAPQLTFTNFLLSGSDTQGLELSGEIGPSRWDFRMAGKGLDVGTLAGLAGFPYPLSGNATIGIRGTGDFAHPHLEGSIDLSHGSALGLSYLSGQAAFVWQNERITFTKLSLTDPGRYTLVGTGWFPVVRQAGDQPLDPKINFSLRLVDSNLGLLQSLSSEVKKARGNVQGLLQVTGTTTAPRLTGSLRVTDGDIIGAHYFKRLQNVLLSIDFSGDKIILRELQGDSGKGTFLAAGDIKMNGFSPSAYDLHADITSSRGLGVQVPELAIPESPLAKRFHFLTTISQSDVQGHVTFQGPADAPLFKGDTTISNGHFTFPASRKNPPPPALLDWFRKINWDVGLRFQDGAWFENEFVQASLAGNLRIKGPSDALRVDGNMDITQGEISYLGLEFAIRQARFDINSNENNSVITNTPFVSGVAESQVQATDTLNNSSGAGNRLSFNDTITLTIDRAPVDEIKPRLTSANNPNLSQEKVLARATQIDLNNLTPQERTYVYQQQMIQILDTGLATPLAKNFLKRTGLVDNFRVQHVIDPSGVSPVVATPNSPSGLTPVNQSPFANTKYTVEKDLFNRVTVGYGVRFVPVLTPDLQDKLNIVSDVQLSYRWFKNVYVKGDLDLPNSNPGIVPERKVTIEPTFRFGWWGNTNAVKLKIVRTSIPQNLAHIESVPAISSAALSTNR